MTTTPDPHAALKPCPFCGAGETTIHPNGKMWTGMKYSEPVSVSIRHWCTAVEGQPSRMIERIGKDEPSAIAAWNRRAPPEPQQAEPRYVSIDVISRNFRDVANTNKDNWGYHHAVGWNDALRLMRDYSQPLPQQAEPSGDLSAEKIDALLPCVTKEVLDWSADLEHRYKVHMTFADLMEFARAILRSRPKEAEPLRMLTGKEFEQASAAWGSAIGGTLEEFAIRKFCEVNGLKLSTEAKKGGEHV